MYYLLVCCFALTSAYVEVQYTDYQQSLLDNSNAEVIEFLDSLNTTSNEILQVLNSILEAAGDPGGALTLDDFQQFESRLAKTTIDYPKELRDLGACLDELKYFDIVSVDGPVRDDNIVYYYYATLGGGSTDPVFSDWLVRKFECESPPHFIFYQSEDGTQLEARVYYNESESHSQLTPTSRELVKSNIQSMIVHSYEGIDFRCNNKFMENILPPFVFQRTEYYTERSDGGEFCDANQYPNVIAHDPFDQDVVHQNMRNAVKISLMLYDTKKEGLCTLAFDHIGFTRKEWHEDGGEGTTVTNINLAPYLRQATSFFGVPECSPHGLYLLGGIWSGANYEITPNHLYSLPWFQCDTDCNRGGDEQLQELAAIAVLAHLLRDHAQEYLGRVASYASMDLLINNYVYFPDMTMGSLAVRTDGRPFVPFMFTQHPSINMTSPIPEERFPVREFIVKGRRKVLQEKFAQAQRMVHDKLDTIEEVAGSVEHVIETVETWVDRFFDHLQRLDELITVVNEILVFVPKI